MVRRTPSSKGDLKRQKELPREGGVRRPITRWLSSKGDWKAKKLPREGGVRRPITSWLSSKGDWKAKKNSPARGE